ncbi:hypothetical protein DMN91_003484 [Ooceraea biroi]|uniref:Uncharacterized protein n=1 Tax=Ooceraea biroi TaxID=2015173 RepID=A0A3L8DS95_OOCBI|nr:uncharacterized protein LOC105285250 isoform X1 [Ooceraea biroi]RLU23281.1 hypothetical protein DMN91_003484 [Ooceraea biroi]
MARNMALLYDGHDYYKKMFELQEKLRKSEEERIRLEERFNVLVRESGTRHEACINRLRMRYIHYLEEQRTRDERNHKLLAALDRVMSKLALISAKKDRLNVLRKQYEAYLLRVYANRQPPSSVTGDSGIASQHENKYPRKTVMVETRNIPSPRAHPTAPPRSSQPRSTFASKFHDQVPVDDVSPINHPILPTASSGAAPGTDYHQASVLYAPQVHASAVSQSGDQFVHQAPVSRALDAHPCPQMTFEGGAFPSDLRNVPNRIPVSSMPMADQTQPEFPVHPVNQFFREHVESGQAGLSPTARLPAGDATRHAEGEFIPRQFDLPASFRYYDSVLPSDPQSQMRKYDTFDAAASMRPNSVIAKSSSYRLNPDASADQLGSLPGYMDYILSPRKSEDGGSVRSLTSDDVDDLIRRNERLLWRNADVAKTRRSPIMLGVNDADLDENGRTTAILENELDRYISNIRRLHREHGVQSLEELDHEQNTSGDLLNVTLSEDALELPAEDRKDKKERIPEEMSKILALANDLVSKTADAQEVARSAEDGIRYRDVGQISKNEIREDNVTIHSTGLERSRADAEIAKRKSDDRHNLTEPRERNREISAAKKNDAKEEMVSSSNDKSRIDNDRGNAPQEKRPVVGEETDIEDLFDVAEQLAPWDLASVQKQVLELHLDDSEGEKKAVEAAANQSDEVANKLYDSPDFIGHIDAENSEMEEPVYLPRDTLLRSEAETRDSEESHEKHETRARIEEAEDMPPEIYSHREADEPIKTDEPIIVPQIEEQFNEPDKDDNQKRDSDETMEPQIEERVVQQEEYSAQEGYMEDPNQAQRYAQQDPNQQYSYDPNMTYEGGAGDEEYERYADQGYAQESQQYVEYVDGQYEQYPEDPNSQQYQQDPNVQYQQDPNQAYAYNYDPNQGYEGDPNQQYDPNQGYGDDPSQMYGYTEQAYDPNQAYGDDAMYEQGYHEEQREDNGVVNAEGQEEPQPGPQEILQSPQVDSQSEHKSGEDDKLRQTDAANGTNQSKKKDVIKSLLDSDTDTTIEKNVSNTESDFDFN